MKKHIQGDKIEDLSVWSYGFWLALTVHVASMFLDPSRFSRSALLLSSLTTQSKQVGAEEPKETTHNVPHNSTPKGEIMEILTLWALHGYSEKNDKTSAVKLRRQENLVHSQVGKFWQGPSLNIRQGPWAFHAWPKFKSGFRSSVGNKFDCSDWFMGWQHIREQKKLNIKHTRWSKHPKLLKSKSIINLKSLKSELIEIQKCLFLCSTCYHMIVCHDKVEIEISCLTSQLKSEL